MYIQTIKENIKKVSIIFTSSFALNIVWENLHSPLYSNYMGGEITEFILVRAALFDAVIITIILTPFIFLKSLNNKSYLIIIIGIIIAILNEWYGLSTARWAYNNAMPILPILEVGLTPALQLGVLGYISYRLSRYF